MFVSVDRHQSQDTEKPREREREPERDIIRRLHRMARVAYEHPTATHYVTCALEAERFVEGDQIDRDVLAILEERRQPATIENLCRRQVIRQLKSYKKMRTRPAFIGRNALIDDALATAFRKLDRYVDEQASAPDEELLAVRDMLVTGHGWLNYEGTRDAQGLPRIDIQHEPWRHMRVDPYATRKDLNEDARFVLRGKWIDLEDAIAMWPDKEVKLRRLINHGSTYYLSDLKGSSLMSDIEGFYLDRSRGRIFVVEVWYKRLKSKREQELDQLLGNLGVSNDKPVGPSPFDRHHAHELWVGIFCHETLIHHGRSPYDHPFFPFVRLVHYLKASGEPQGLFPHDVLSLQKDINQRRQKMLHLMISRQTIMEENAVDDLDEFAKNRAAPDGIMIVKQGKKDKIELVSNIDAGQAQAQLYQQDKQAFEQVHASSALDFGDAPGEIRSNAGLTTLKEEGIGMAIEIHENIRLARRMSGRVKMGLIRQYFQDDFVVQVTDNQKDLEVLEITAEQFDQFRDDAVDLMIVEEKDFETSKQQQLELIVQVMAQIRENPSIGKFILALTDLDNKEELMQMLDQANQPRPTEPKLSLTANYNDMPAAEKIAFASAMHWPELAQQIAENPSMSNKELQALVQQTLSQSKERIADQGSRERIFLELKKLGVQAEEKDIDRIMDVEKTVLQEETKREIAKKHDGGSEKT